MPSPLESLRTRFAGLQEAITNKALVGACVMIRKRMDQAMKLPLEQRKETLRGISHNITGLIQRSPDMAYYLHECSGVCSHELGDTQATLYHFGKAVDLHPTKVEKGYFKDYVFNYLAAVRHIPGLPSEDQRPAYQSAADQIQSLVPTLPSIAHNLEDHLGFCFMGLGQPKRALGHYENAVLTHPNSGPGSDLPQYETNYLACVRTIAQRAILNRHGKARQQAIQDFVSVFNSTANVLSKYPDNGSVAHERRVT